MHPSKMKAIEKSNKKWLERSVEKQQRERVKRGHPWKTPHLSSEFKWLLQDEMNEKTDKRM